MLARVKLRYIFWVVLAVIAVLLLRPDWLLVPPKI
jgi:hypothetical protein